MADTKQATAETVCEHCGLEIWDKFYGLNGSHWRTKSTGGFCIKSADGHVPRTQPSQTELHCIACGEPADHAHKGGYSMCGACCGLWGLSLDGEFGEEVHEWIKKLIARIARLEGGR